MKEKPHTVDFHHSCSASGAMPAEKRRSRLESLASGVQGGYPTTTEESVSDNLRWLLVDYKTLKVPLGSSELAHWMRGSRWEQAHSTFNAATAERVIDYCEIQRQLEGFTKDDSDTFPFHEPITNLDEAFAFRIHEVSQRTQTEYRSPPIDSWRHLINHAVVFKLLEYRFHVVEYTTGIPIFQQEPLPQSVILEAPTTAPPAPATYHSSAASGPTVNVHTNSRKVSHSRNIITLAITPRGLEYMNASAEDRRNMGHSKWLALDSRLAMASLPSWMSLPSGEVQGTPASTYGISILRQFNVEHDEGFSWPLTLRLDEPCRLEVKKLISIASRRLQHVLQNRADALIGTPELTGSVYRSLNVRYRFAYDSVLNMYQKSLQSLARRLRNSELERRVTDLRFLPSNEEQFRNLLAAYPASGTADQHLSRQQVALPDPVVDGSDAGRAKVSLDVSLVERREDSERTPDEADGIYHIVAHGKRSLSTHGTIHKIRLCADVDERRRLALENFYNINEETRNRVVGGTNNTQFVAFPVAFCERLSTLPLWTISDAFLVFASAFLRTQPLHPYNGLRFFVELSENRVVYSCPLCVQWGSRQQASDNCDVSKEMAKFRRHFNNKHALHYPVAYSCTPTFTMQLFVYKSQLQIL